MPTFLKTVVVTAVVAFAAATGVLNPRLIDDFSVDRLLAQLDVGSATHPQPAVPTAAPSGGYVQTSFAQCPQFFPNEKPPAVPAGPALRELCFTSFALLHSGRTKTPVFVAERLNRQKILAARGIKRTGHFYEEARLPRAERAKLADYRGSGFDRGHMAPAGDMYNDRAMAQSFSLANMVPQNAEHNRGAWSKIEQDTRKYILHAKGDVYVFTGPVYGEHPQTIGKGHVAVPAYLYELVYDATSRRAWVHWQTNDADEKAGTLISYDEFVRRTGLSMLGK